MTVVTCLFRSGTTSRRRLEDLRTPLMPIIIACTSGISHNKKRGITRRAGVTVTDCSEAYWLYVAYLVRVLVT